MSQIAVSDVLLLSKYKLSLPVLLTHTLPCLSGIIHYATSSFLTFAIPFRCDRKNTFKSWWIDKCIQRNISIALRDLLKRFTSLSQKAPQLTPKPTLLLASMKYGTMMNYTQHLLIWHAKYTWLMWRYRSLCGGTPVPQCDKALMPHLSSPTESFGLYVLLIFLIFHASQRWPLTGGCLGEDHRLLFGLSVFNCALRRWMRFKGEGYWFKVEWAVIVHYNWA